MPTLELPYVIVDVFTQTPLEGNPLAVFLDGAALDTVTMQKIARELNLSETAFILPATEPGCAMRVRIFTPMYEMRFAGHPTVGTAAVLRSTSLIPPTLSRLSLQEEVGPVAIRIDDGPDPLIWLTTPPVTAGPTRDREFCAEALGLTVSDLLTPLPQIFTAGNPNLYIPLLNPEAVDRIQVNSSKLVALQEGYPDPLCLFAFTPVATGAYSRMFAPAHGVVEDPATGSATGPLVVYMHRNNLLAPGLHQSFISEQGTKMGRRSLLHATLNPVTEQTEVGGRVTPLAEGTMHLPRQ